MLIRIFAIWAELATIDLW